MQLHYRLFILILYNMHPLIHQENFIKSRISTILVDIILTNLPQRLSPTLGTRVLSEAL